MSGLLNFWRRPGQTPLSGLRERIRPVLTRARDEWRRLSRRERRQIALMGAVLAVAAVWLLLVKPALDTLAYWHGELPRLRSQAAALQEILADVGVGAQTPSASLPPVERLRTSLDEAGLAGSHRIEASGEAFQIVFERPTDAARLANWLLNAPAPLGMSVRRAVLSRQPEEDEGRAPGGAVRVHAVVTLAVQPSAGRGP
ncbi:type II secretion system protein GspM [Brenneria populi subsp. brevivirga]|uniref:type II secretion system protein GspM n=1 Tax=Brenneria populi TaxID=1505588 RepID=UPI002E18F2B3|nr:type II secretion system protein GspM [Brenneria populi subsp. brevivirga]